MNKKGFTLIELLAVIAIIGVLATIAVTSIIKIYNDSVKKTMVVQENNVSDVSKSYLEDYCFDPLDGSYNCPKSYDNNTNNRYICLSDLQENEKDNYINKVTYKNESCKGIIVFSKDDEGEYTKAKTYLYCDYDSRNNKYNYITDETLDTSLYPRCNISSGILPSDESTTTTTTTKPVDTACTFNGELKQGAEFVSGQYTYRYKQEGKLSSTTNLEWSNITTDGWGVQLTDKDSTNAVTTKLCNYINEKPIVSMSYMFYKSNATSIDLSSFDTINAVNMSNMFAYTVSNTLDTSNFDTSKVTNMSGMFYNSKATTLNVDDFNTSNVINMSSMFGSSSAISINVSNFDTSKVTNMSSMFYNSKATTLDVSNFKTSNVTNMSNMFYGTVTKSLDVSNFNTSNVTTMRSMFQNSAATSLNVSNFNTSKVTDMGSLFNSSKSTTLDVSNFNTSSVVDMSRMFENSIVTTLDLSNFNTSKVTNMTGTFKNSKVKKLDVSSFNTSNVTSMQQLFWNAVTTTLDLSNFNTSKVTSMSYMFDNIALATLDLSSFDTSNVTNMMYMFYNDANLKTIYVSNKFTTSKVTNSTNMFNRSSLIVGGLGTKYNESYIDKTYARIDDCDNPGYFSDKNSALSGNFSTDSWSKIISNVRNGKSCIYKVGDTKSVNVGTYGTHNVRIANMSTPSDCSGSTFSQTACGFVLEFEDIVTPYKMNSTDTNVGGWPACSARTFLNSTFYSALPSDLRSGIIDTTVVSGSGQSDSGCFTSTDKIYLLSTVEIWSLKDSATAIKTDKSRIRSRQLDYYEKIGVTTANYSGAIKKSDPSVDFDWWWTRSAYSSDTHTFFAVNPSGDYYQIGAKSNPTGVSPAFRIG